MLDKITEKLSELANGSAQFELDAPHVLASLGVALVCAVLIYATYRWFYRGVVYNDNFGALTAMIAVVTAFIIITIGANLVLSLGMVGALSIVRFRAAVKDPLDVGFLFWAVSAGLTAGARLYVPALVGTAFVAVVYIAFYYLRRGKKQYLLIIRADKSAAKEAESMLGGIKWKLKNRTLTAGYSELTAEIAIKSNDGDLVEKISAIEGVESATLIEYTGDYN